MSNKENNLNNRQADNFDLPENYFQKSSQAIFDKIEWQEEHKEVPMLLKYRNREVFGLPENYFERSETELELPDYQKLSSLEKQNRFSVPNNYFDENEARLNTLLAETKIIHLFSRKMWHAAAALLIIASGFWIYNLYFVPAQPEDCGALACVDKADLVKTKTLESFDNEDLYNMVNSEKLEEHLNSNNKTEAEEELLDEI